MKKFIALWKEVRTKCFNVMWKWFCDKESSIHAGNSYKTWCYQNTFNYHAHFRSAGIKFKAFEIFSSVTWMKLNIVLYLPIFIEAFAFASGPSVLFCSFASQWHLFQIKNLCKMHSYVYMLTRISFSKTLYKKQIAEQRKDTT